MNLSDKMDKDGILHWQVPEGQWTVLRMGDSLTGAKNRPAAAAGLGYEVDKLNQDYVRTYFQGYMGPIRSIWATSQDRLCKYMMLDS